MTNLLITGGSGFVGQNLAQFFSSRGSVVTTHHRQPARDSRAPSLQLDVRDVDAVISTFERAQPGIVIHAAGNKNVKFCEDHPAEAHQVNALGTRNVARACKRMGSRMIYLSTDLVFDGQQGNYREGDEPRPTSAYGITKLEGERLARQELADVAVCRSAGIYGASSPLLNWLATELLEGRSVDCFVDVFNSPTYVENLGEMMERIMQTQLGGIFHTAGSQRVNRYEFFQTYARVFGLRDDLLLPVAAGKLKESLLLQPDSSLSVTQTAVALGMVFNSVEEGFARLKTRGGL